MLRKYRPELTFIAWIHKVENIGIIAKKSLLVNSFQSRSEAKQSKGPVLRYDTVYNNINTHVIPMRVLLQAKHNSRFLVGHKHSDAMQILAKYM